MRRADGHVACIVVKELLASEEGIYCMELLKATQLSVFIAAYIYFNKVSIVTLPRRCSTDHHQMGGDITRLYVGVLRNATR